ncbi:diguanylate cyclase/phosphodiesterase (GGDEF & EAL domains) with PAS/PAC sensor(s) [hydrothermal vent metagenome]|uniref:Diguanylate cyclase/phosphodiesterase (GGDEF & EAL domains) with PAS/PAC sensor(S) n=1 Tax=hydrothermal vent metagenome TaxID=652676 RepID=A0A1W1CTC9_9ZZZZ
MKNVQIILNAILSKNIFEYILVDRKLHVISASQGVRKYVNAMPKEGDDVLKYLPELVGNEEEIKEIFVKKYCLYTLESVYKNNDYVNMSVEYCDQNTAIILLHNITAITRAQQSLLQYSNESTLLYNTLQKVVDSQNTMLFVTNAEKIEFANKKFLNFFHAENIEEIQKKELKLYQRFDTSLQNYRDLFVFLKEGEKYLKLGKDIFIVQATQIELAHTLFTLTKITDFPHEMQLDPLTGLYRKDYLNEMVEKSLQEKRNFALVVMDLDNFKLINDTYGHLTGDKVLKAFVMILKQHIRKTDLLVRWGGDEFLLFLEDGSPEDAILKIESIRKLIDKYHFETIGHLSCSFGLSYAKENDSVDSLLQRADKALYEAKIKGKNRVLFKED